MKQSSQDELSQGSRTTRSSTSPVSELRKNTATATKILSLFLFLQVRSFSWMFLWSLHSILNTGRRQSESYFIVLCFIIHLRTLPALEHCWSTDWSRILKRSEKYDSLQSICQRKVTASVVPQGTSVQLSFRTSMLGKIVFLL